MPKPAPSSPEKQVTRLHRQKLVLIPAGEFMMGSGESAEATADYFKENSGVEHDAALRARAPPAPRADHQAVLPGGARTSRGGSSGSSSRHGLQDRCREGRQAGASECDDEKGRFAATRSTLGGTRDFEQTDDHPVVERELERRDGVLPMAESQGRQEVSVADGGRMGIRLPRGDDDALLVRRRSRRTWPQVANVADATAKAKFPAWKERSAPATATFSRLRWAVSGRTHSGSTTCTATRWQGCGLVRADYYAASPQTTQRAQIPEPVAWFAAAPGTTDRTVLGTCLPRQGLVRLPSRRHSVPRCQEFGG